MERIYSPLEILLEEDVERILSDGDMREIIILPLSVGQNHPKWKFAQDLCVKLSEYPDVRVRVNAVRGLAYIARTKRKLEKHIVKPVILKALREEKEYEWQIIDAIKEINLFMVWKIGAKAQSKLKS